MAVMAKAQRVEFDSFGVCEAVAADAQHKFFRLLLAVAACIQTVWSVSYVFVPDGTA